MGSKRDTLRAVAAILFVSTLSGCLTGPNFLTPRSEMPANWSGPMAAGVDATQADITSWWQQFNDGELDALVQRALESNRDLHVAEARVREARAARGLAAEGLLPTGGASGSYAVEGTPAMPGGMQDRTRDLFSAGFDAHWELDVFGGVRRGIEAADADVATARENLHDVQVMLTSEVARNYFELRGAQSRLEIAKQHIAAQKNTLSITTLRFEGGLTSGLDAHQIQAQLSMTESQVPLLEFAILSSIYRIAVLTGQMPQPLVEQLSSPASLPATPPVVPVGMPSDLLRRRPDIRRSEQQLHAATARIGVAVADLFPKFSMAGRVGASFTGLDDINLGDAAFWSLGPSIQFPVLDRGRIRANIAVQNARQEAALAMWEQSVLVAMEDAERALAAYAKEQARRGALEASVSASQQAVTLATDLYTEGLADFLNVLQAQGALYTTQDQLVQSNQVVLQNLVALYKAIGGGWDSSRSTGSEGTEKDFQRQSDRQEVKRPQ